MGVRPDEMSVQFLPGVGPAGAKLLAKLGISTVPDLLQHVPRRYEDRSNPVLIADTRPGEYACISGCVRAAVSSQTSRRGVTIVKVLVSDGSATAQLVFFNQPYLLKAFEAKARRNARLWVYGRARASDYGPVAIEQPEWEEVAEGEDALSADRIVPVYGLTEGLTQRRVRRACAAALDLVGVHRPEVLPQEIVDRLGVISPVTAIRSLHFPESWVALDQSRRRLVFEEFFVLQAGIAKRRLAADCAGRAPAMHGCYAGVTDRLRPVLPYELTPGQSAAVRSVISDMGRSTPMNRLVQGDVGCGKTAVAVAAMVLAVDCGYQAALMAPTEVLAQQHHLSISRVLGGLGLRVGLATGSLTTRSRSDIRARMRSGEVDVVVGTHALVQSGAQFGRLGLAVIDEQHKFGVLQRQALREKGASPHTLVMTATPIPRTLTMTIYGDLDVSVISDKPPGRVPVKTHWKPRSAAARVYGGVGRLLEQGQQAYVVCPLVDESEKVEAQAAMRLAARVQSDLLPAFRVGLMHGQLGPDDKQRVMAQFAAHEIDVLVATTVIEVGVDIPNASVIVIEDADRFGLAQLHQLRGRVGRGRQASYCVLVADPATDEGRARLETMARTSDGFEIAEEDLRLRGPGEFFGTRQSGLPALVFGDIVRDGALMEDARREALAVLQGDQDLVLPVHAALRAAVDRMDERAALGGVA